MLSVGGSFLFSQSYAPYRISSSAGLLCRDFSSSWIVVIQWLLLTSSLASHLSTCSHVSVCPHSVHGLVSPEVLGVCPVLTQWWVILQKLALSAGNFLPSSSALTSQSIAASCVSVQWNFSLRYASYSGPWMLSWMVFFHSPSHCSLFTKFRAIFSGHFDGLQIGADCSCPYVANMSASSLRCDSFVLGSSF